MYDRAWLLTWTCYGNWLPGDARGFVGNHWNELGERVSHNQPDTEYTRDIQRLNDYCRRIQKSPTARLTSDQAQLIIPQMLETGSIRGWSVQAIAIMANHVHIVVLVPGDPEPETLLHSFKSYASRVLNRQFGKQSWWTESGSTVKLPDNEAVRAAVEYVRNQQFSLDVYVNDRSIDDD